MKLIVIDLQPLLVRSLALSCSTYVGWRRCLHAMRQSFASPCLDRDRVSFVIQEYSVTLAATTTFSSLGLDQHFESVLARLGISEPTPIQAQAIPLLLEGRDVIASAPTGTGKTAAFLLPSLARRSDTGAGPNRAPRILVLTPTRELAQQVAKASISFSKGLQGARTVCITGGESYREQDRMLSGPIEVMVATPGRLLDQINSRRIDLSRVEVFVLDEADRMLDMGFSEDVLTIASALPAERQTVCFTATLSHSIRDFASRVLRDPAQIEAAPAAARHDNIEQHVVFVDDVAHKRRLLNHWLADHGTGQSIIFTATKRDAEWLAQTLEEEGHSTVALHGDLQQRQRTRMLTRLRRGEARILVATDVASRGIDVPAITHVFNYDLPRFAEDYVHRIGRTGRAGASGIAVSFVGSADMGVLKRIERFIGRKVKVTAIQGLEGRYRPAERGDRRDFSRPHSHRPHKPQGPNDARTPRYGDGKSTFGARGRSTGMGNTDGTSTFSGADGRRTQPAANAWRGKKEPNRYRGK
ncbi:MAG: DEAD/DEAH box helicase [Methylotetracoccus sp.]